MTDQDEMQRALAEHIDRATTKAWNDIFKEITGANMKHKVSFVTPTQLDKDMIHMFGVSVKSGDTPFGYFGTGLKYALAICNRLGYEIFIHTPDYKCSIVSRTKLYRNEPMEVLFAIDDITGEELQLSFTNELGKNWEPWQAFRELYCNTIDEDGEVVTGGLRNPISGQTVITISGDASVSQHWEELERRVLQLNKSRENVGMVPVQGKFEDSLEAWNMPSSRLYMKGVDVGDVPCGMPSMFTYNITSRPTEQYALTEDRQLKRPYAILTEITAFVFNIQDEKLLTEIFTNQSRCLEANELNIYAVPSILPEPAKSVLRNLAIECPEKLSSFARKVARSRFQFETYRPVKYVTRLQEEIIRRAKDTCLNVLQCDRIEEYKIIVSESLGDNILGVADRSKNEIYLSMTCFDYGQKMVTATLFEEYLHLAHGLEDTSRELQNFLLQKIMTLVEENTGKPM